MKNRFDTSSLQLTSKNPAPAKNQVGAWVIPHGIPCPSEVLFGKAKAVGLTYGIIIALKDYRQTLPAQERDKFETSLAADYDDHPVVKKEMQRWLNHMRKKMVKQWQEYTLKNPFPPSDETGGLK